MLSRDDQREEKRKIHKRQTKRHQIINTLFATTGGRQIGKKSREDIQQIMVHKKL